MGTRGSWNSDEVSSLIDGQVGKKLADLVKTYPKLLAFREDLRELLHRRRHYKASILIASRQFNVRARSLEQKSNGPF